MIYHFVPAALRGIARKLPRLLSQCTFHVISRKFGLLFEQCTALWHNRQVNLVDKAYSSQSSPQINVLFPPISSTRMCTEVQNLYKKLLELFQTTRMYQNVIKCNITTQVILIIFNVCTDTTQCPQLP